MFKYRRHNSSPPALCYCCSHCSLGRGCLQANEIHSLRLMQRTESREERHWAEWQGFLNLLDHRVLTTQHLLRWHSSSASLPGHLTGLSKEKSQTLSNQRKRGEWTQNPFLPESASTPVLLPLPDPSWQSTLSCDGVIMQFSSAFKLPVTGHYDHGCDFPAPIQSSSMTLVWTMIPFMKKLLLHRSP